MERICILGSGMAGYGAATRLHDEGMAMGFQWVESGPLVRSSYHADGQADALVPARTHDG